MTPDAQRPRTYGCQACGAPLNPDEAFGSAAVRCRFCGAFTRIPGTAPFAGLRAAVERPRSIQVEETGRGLRIVRRWWSPVFLFLAFFCAIWNGILIAFYGLAFGAGTPWFVGLFPLIHVAVGLCLAYFTLCGFLNRTYVEVERRGTVSVTHGPLPWRGTPPMDAPSITQVFVSRKARTSKDGTSTASYTLATLSKDGARRTLLSLPTLTLDEALYLEQEVERHLDLVDLPVRGEVPHDER